MEGFILGGVDDFRMWELAGNLLEIKHSHGKSLIHDVSLNGKKVMKANGGMIQYVFMAVF